MNNICKRQFLGGTSAHIIRKAMAALALLVVYGFAYAQEQGHDRKEASILGSIPSPTTPERITPGVGNSAFLLGHAFGTQGYVCLPNPAGGISWTVTVPVRKPRSSRISLGRRSRSSPISSALSKIRTT